MSAWEILCQTCSFSYKEHNCKQNGMRIRLNNTLYVFFSVLADVKTGWKVGNWPLIQPRHCQQRDGYNCGVFVWIVGLSVSFVYFNNWKVKRKEYKIIYVFTFCSFHDVLFKGSTSRLSFICKRNAEDFFQRCLALATMTYTSKLTSFL